MLEILRKPPSTSRSNRLGYGDRALSGVPEMDLKILVHALEATTRLEREDLFHSGIHDYVNFEHAPVLGTDLAPKRAGPRQKNISPNLQNEC